MTTLSFEIDGGAGHDRLSVDDMGCGTIVLTSYADPAVGGVSSVVVSIDQMRTALAGLEGR